ncbi:MAG: phosphohydrolase [Ferruginibacter sp.]|nr:phosphohydrolase [Ferruginibacter sp.]
MDSSHIYKNIEQHVTGLFSEHQSPKLVFHNLHHTEYVVNKGNEIAGHYQLSEQEMLVVFLATWFHDTGYLFVAPADHEEKSVDTMKLFARENQLPFDVVNDAAGCILATRSPRNPIGLLQGIVCDADTYNFGSKEFKKTNELVFTEFQNGSETMLSRKKFDQGALEMLKNHQFYTSYCKDLLKDIKKVNMKKLKKKLDKKDNEGYDYKKAGGEITEKEGTTKGMQTMLRLTSSNHIQLSEMADSKANILISVNAIIISVILSVLLRKLQTDPYLTIPTIIFLLFSVITIVVAILATRPKVNAGTFSATDVENKKTNLLFFGNFHGMSLIDYENAMRSMMKDADYLYSSIIQDIYHLGVVLGRKYKLIRWAYNIFMVGIIISVLSFALASYFYTPTQAAAGTNTTGSPF